MSTVAPATRPEIGNSAFYCTASPQARKLRVTVTVVFADGRIRVVPPDGTWKSLPCEYQRRVQTDQYGLVRIE